MRCRHDTPGLRCALVALGAVALVTEGLALALTLGSEHDPAPVATAVLGSYVGLSFTGTGLYAWWRRPSNRVGPLMAWVGFAWFLTALQASGRPALFTAGLALGNVFLGAAVHMLLAFPSGRLGGPAERRLVAATYALTGPVCALVIPWTDPAAGGDCPGCPRNVLLISNQPALAERLATGIGLAAVGLALAVAWVLVRRLRRTPAPRRRALAYVYAVGGLTMGLLGLSLVLDAAGARGAALGAGTVFLVAFGAVPIAFVAGLLRSRVGQAVAVEDLVARLGAAGAAPGVRDALAGALGDPTLELAYWLPDRGCYADDAGRPLALPGPGAGRGVTEVAWDGRPVAAIVHHHALCDERDLVRTAGAAAALALANEQLRAALRARVQELEGSEARLLAARETARRTLERRLSDGAEHRLAGLSAQLEEAARAAGEDPARAAELLDAARADLLGALEDLREVARGVHPAVLSSHGLRTALEALAARCPVEVELAALPETRLPAALESAAYFVAAEAVAEAVRRGGATRVEVRVQQARGEVVVEVADDGRPLAPREARAPALSGLADRVAALEGRLDVLARARGALVRARLPLHPPAEPPAAPLPLPAGPRFG